MNIRTRLGVCAVLFITGVSACGGDKGATGANGMDGMTGMTGSDGPPGPITTPPALTGLSPTWGSANTHVTLTGTGFSTTPGDNHVYFDGHAATVVAATATSLEVTPGVATDGDEQLVVNVEVANQVSNGLAFELVASGSAHPLDVALPSAPTGVAVVGTDVYFASGVNGSARNGGLFKLANGVTTLVVPGTLVTITDPNTGNSVEVIDGPVAVATSGGNVYYTTTFGTVRKYDVASGAITDVLSAFGNGPAFPARTGIAFDAGGDMYVVDRNFNNGSIIRLRANGTLNVVQDTASNEFGATNNQGIFAITTDGTDLFVTNQTTGTVYKVGNLATTATITTVGDLTNAQGIALVGTTLVVSRSDGTLWQTPKTATGAVMTAYGDTGGYMYAAPGMAVSGTDLLMAQPGGAALRKLPQGMTSSIVAAGVRVAFGTTLVGGNWYVATVGAGVFGGVSVTQPDGAILEIAPTGSRVLANTILPFGVVSSAAGELTVADCGAQRIFKIDVASGTQTDRLTSTDGLACPTALVVDSGTLYYIDAPTGTAASLGTLAGTTNTAGFGTGFAQGTNTLALAGGKLVASSLNSGFNPLQAVTAASGGAATTLTSGAVAGNLMLGSSPAGTLYGVAPFTGELSTVDPATGTVTPFGSTRLASNGIGTGTNPFAFSIGFSADGTLQVMDLAQGLLQVAP